MKNICDNILIIFFSITKIAREIEAAEKFGEIRCMYFERICSKKIYPYVLTEFNSAVPLLFSEIFKYLLKILYSLREIQ